MKTPIASARWRRGACSEAPASQRTSASGPRYRLAENIGFTAIIVTELKLSQVERQILFRDVMEAAHDSALEKTPERFQIVRVDLASNVLTLTMADSFVREI